MTLEEAIKKHADSFEPVQKIRAKEGTLGKGAAIKQLEKLGFRICVKSPKRQSAGE